MKKKSRAKLLLVSVVFIFKNFNAYSQTISSYYFRSAQSGAWDAPASWESSPDGIANWVSATQFPTSAANTVTIRNGHTISISNTISIDQVIVSSGGVLQNSLSSSSILTMNDAEGVDVTIQSGGIFRHNSLVLPTFAPSSVMQVQTGGMLEVVSNSGGNAQNYASTASPIASNINWADSSIFNWNTTSAIANGITYFPSNTAIPVFKVSQIAAIGGTSATTVNGILQANATVNLQSGGNKIFRNGITGTGKVGVTAVSNGQIIINGTTAKLGGAGSLELGNNGLSIALGTTLTLISDKTINSYISATGTVATSAVSNKGILIAGNYIVSGTSKIQIDGTVKTTNSNGLTGTSNTTFALGFGVTVSATTSTIEYNREGNQLVTPLTYYNLLITGSGNKTVGSGTDIIASGTLTVSSGNTFTLNGTNDLKLNGGGTLTINANAVFDTGGESQTSGGGSPTVNIYGTFITRNAQGFSGTGSSLPGATTTPAPTISVNISSASTIEYGRLGDQSVIARNDYKNMTFSGSGIKTLSNAFNPAGTVLIKDNAVVEAGIKTFGDAGTKLTMTGGRFRVGSNGTKPDIAGNYMLTGGVIEFTNTGGATQTIRATVIYNNIEVSGSNVANSLGNIAIADQGTLTIKTGGVFTNNAFRIDGSTGSQTLVLEAGSVFKTGTTRGFSGDDNAALKGFETFNIDPKATIVYSRLGDQTITPFSGYPTLLLKGSGNKTVTNGTITIAALADSVVIDPNVVFKVNTGGRADFNSRPVFVKSNANGTGMIGMIADGATALLNATKVTVERYIPAKRSYRFLSPAVNTTGDVKANWMEGVNNTNPYGSGNLNPAPGYGTHITGAGGSVNGFDPTITNNPSLFTYNNSTQKWQAVSNTRLQLKVGNAYRLFVRGSRSTDLTTNTPSPTPTVIRATGAAIAGTVTFDRTINSPVALSAIDTNFSFIGNPYASSVDWEAMVSVNPDTKQVSGTAKDISPTYWTWDPNINVRGNYVYYNAVTQSRNISLSKVDRYIQPGQAFFVRTTGANANPSLQFKEVHKTQVTTNVFRTYSETPKISIQLLLENDTLSEHVADGIVAFFGEDFSKNIENEDSRKIANLDENLSIDHLGTDLSMEGRPLIQSTDSIFLKMWQLRHDKYFLRIEATNMFSTVEAFLEDDYLHRETPVDLSKINIIPFNLNKDSASFAIDRFTLLFKINKVLSENSIVANAYLKSNGIMVGWSATAENDVTGYEIQKSTDGREFTKIDSVSKINAVSVTKYSWLDANVNPGNNFYRIKALVSSGIEKFSNTVVVNFQLAGSFVKIFPNPIIDNIINVKINNMKKGAYNIHLYNNLFQKVYSTTLLYNGGLVSYPLKTNKCLTKGIYRLEVSGEKERVVKTVIIK